VPLQPFGLPALSADATATVSDGALVVGAHGMTLRLGAAARVAFGTLGLEQRALPGTASGFVTALAGLAHSDDGAHSGCDALDGALCAALARPAGCLTAACQAGLTALAARLDAAFDAADGGGLDLYLSGQAPLFDRHGNGAADRIGDTQATPPDPGTWSVDLLMSAGRVQASGTWEADRSGN